MKKLFFFISVILFHANFVFSQISRGYTLNKTSEENIECEIDLYKSGEYEIFLQIKETEDIYSGVLISSGYYTLKNGELDLLDDYSGYKMLFSIQNKFIIAKKSFKFIVNKMFMKNSSYIPDKPINDENKNIPLNQERLKNQYNKKNYPLQFGEYGSLQGLNLKILSNKKYQIGYKKIVLSEGIWNRKGNEIILFDILLKHPFYSFIDKIGIICKFLPEQDIDTVLNFNGK